MEARKYKQAPPKPIRWDDAEWAWLAEVAKSVGLTRSSFIKFATLQMARATAGSGIPYSVSGTPQNTRPNQISRPIAKQGGSEVGGERSRTRLNPEDFIGQHAEQVGREGGDFSPNEAKPKANKAKALRS